MGMAGQTACSTGRIACLVSEQDSSRIFPTALWQTMPFGCSPDGNASVLPSSFLRTRHVAPDRPSQLVNLDELARVAKKYGLKVKVTGAADSATGTIGINNALSASRADYIASELNKRGLSPDRMTKTGEGGISDYAPRKPTDIQGWNCSSANVKKTNVRP